MLVHAVFASKPEHMCTQEGAGTCSENSVVEKGKTGLLGLHHFELLIFAIKINYYFYNETLGKVRNLLWHCCRYRIAYPCTYWCEALCSPLPGLRISIKVNTTHST